jgi:hypothetical protein
MIGRQTSHAGCNACDARFRRVLHRICFSNVAHMKPAVMCVSDTRVGCALLTRLSRVCRPFIYCRCRALLARRKCARPYFWSVLYNTEGQTTLKRTCVCRCYADLLQFGCSKIGYHPCSISKSMDIFNTFSHSWPRQAKLDFKVHVYVFSFHFWNLMRNLLSFDHAWHGSVHELYREITGILFSKRIL